MSGESQRRAYQGWWSLAGTGFALIGLFWIARRLDLAQLRAAVLGANPLFLAIVPLAIIGEQLVRAWKWRQILWPCHAIPTLRLFGAIMAGYLASLLAPFGLGPLTRSWLVARRDGLAIGAALASVAVDRLTDGFAFAAVVLFVVVFAAIPSSGGDIRFGLAVAATGSLGAIVAAVVLLWRHKRAAGRDAGWVLSLIDRLPRRFSPHARAFALAFAEGTLWPEEWWRRAAIVAASLLIKLIAASHLLWAGLAFGVLLSPVAYLVLLAILGFIVVLAQVARVPGGFVLGAVFALGLFGVGEARALAMVTLVVASSLARFGVFGTLTLWRHVMPLAPYRSTDPSARSAPLLPASSGCACHHSRQLTSSAPACC